MVVVVPMQKAFKELPDGYRSFKELNLAKNQKLMIKLSLASLVLFVVFGVLFTWLLHHLRENFIGGGAEISLVNFNLAALSISLLVLLAVLFLMVVLHEGVHGLFFWMFTGGQVQFGFKGAYAYAAAPDWYIPKKPYLVVSLAPLVIITVLGFITMLFVPYDWILPILLLITLNASGAVGDLYAFFWIVKQPKEVLIQDFGDRMHVYHQNGVDL